MHIYTNEVLFLLKIFEFVISIFVFLLVLKTFEFVLYISVFLLVLYISALFVTGAPAEFVFAFLFTFRLVSIFV